MKKEELEIKRNELLKCMEKRNKIGNQIYFLESESQDLKEKINSLWDLIKYQEKLNETN